MDDRQFDALTKRLGSSRRALLKKMVGLGGAVVATSMLADDVDAARRGYSGPQMPATSGGTFDICSAANPFCCVTCFNPDRDYAQRTLDQCTRRGQFPCDYCAAMAMCVVKTS